MQSRLDSEISDMEDRFAPRVELTDLEGDFTQLTRGLALSEDIDSIQASALGLYSEEDLASVFSEEELLRVEE